LGGLVCFLIYPGFVGPRPTTADHVVDHLVYIADRIGIDKVAIGADFMDFALELMGADMMKHDHLYSPEDFVFPNGVEDTTKLSLLLERLGERGLGAAEVRAVARDNFLRFWRDVECSATTP
jgi:membrane dipeptidase